LPSNIRLASIALFSIVGIGYSGYLTYYTLSTGASACELFFFGMPSCFYGLLLYLFIFVPSLAVFLEDKSIKRSAGMLGLSVFGIGFSGTLTGYFLSFQGCLAKSFTIAGIPPCVLGLCMFALILGIDLSLLMRAQAKNRMELEAELERSPI
jgi:hypothetical protein